MTRVLLGTSNSDQRGKSCRGVNRTDATHTLQCFARGGAQDRVCPPALGRQAVLLPDLVLTPASQQSCSPGFKVRMAHGHDTLNGTGP